MYLLLPRDKNVYSDPFLYEDMMENITAMEQKSMPRTYTPSVLPRGSSQGLLDAREINKYKVAES